MTQPRAFAPARRLAISVACLGLTASGCATTGAGAPQTVQQKIVRCAAVAGGAGLLGAVIGNNVGDGDAKSGALIGAGLGGAACAAWTAFAGDDRRRLEDAQRRAVVENRTITDSWTGADGKPRRVVASPAPGVVTAGGTPAAAPAIVGTSASAAGSDASPAAPVRTADAAPRICRRVDTTASANGSSDTAATTYCRDANGDWTPQLA